MEKPKTLLKVLRLKSGLTQSEVALKIGNTQSFISLLENSQWTSKVDESTLKELAKILSWEGSPSDLLLFAVAV